MVEKTEKTQSVEVKCTRFDPQNLRSSWGGEEERLNANALPQKGKSETPKAWKGLRAGELERALNEFSSLNTSVVGKYGR